MRHKFRIISIGAIVFFAFALDQISKILIINFFNDKNEIIYLTKFLNFDLIWNDGIAFGLLGYGNSYIYNSITVIISFVIILIFYLMINSTNYIVYFYSLIVGGALGNLIDRIRYHAVPDFIDFHIGDYHWFVFNIADIFISLGVFCLIIVEIFYKDKKL